MLASTRGSVARYTSSGVQRRQRQALHDNLRRYLRADRATLDRRLQDLDREWNLERVIEVDAPLSIGLGAVLGLLHDRRWFALSGFSAAMLLWHNSGRGSPLLPLLRCLGLRSQEEIELERMALRVLRKDHQRYQAR